MKSNYFILCLLLGAINLMSQSDWLNYRPLRSLDYLGNAVSGYDPKTFEIKPNPIMNPTFSIKLDSSKGANYSQEFIESFKNFAFPFFSQNKISIANITAVNVVYHSLNIESLSKLKPGQYYIYSGLTADTVKMLLKYDRKVHVSFDEVGKLVNGVLKTFGLEATTGGLIGKAIAQILDGGKYDKGDSAFVKINISDRKVLYKVQGLMYTEISSIGSDYFQYLLMKREKANSETFTYPNRASKGPFYIPYSKKALQMNSNASFPVEFIYAADPLQGNNRNPGFRFIKDLSGGDTTIFVKEQTVNSGGHIDHFWDSYGLLTDIPIGGSIIKKVYYHLYAERTTEDPNSHRERIILVHRDGKQPKTYLTYPEITVKYLH